MTERTTHITALIHAGLLRGRVPTNANVADGYYTIQLSDPESIAGGLTPPTGLIASVKLTADLSVEDTFTELLGFIGSIRASGHVLIYEADELNIITIKAGIVTQFTVQKTEQASAQIEPATMDETNRLKRLIKRLTQPCNAVLYWCTPGPLEGVSTLRIPLEHLLLDTIRELDESSNNLTVFLNTHPDNARLVPSLDTSPNQDTLSILRSSLGVPPYTIGRLKQDNLDQRVLRTLYEAYSAGTLIVERQDASTTPPHLSAQFDVDRIELQNLVARFNHVLRRLVHLSNWTRDELEQQLIVFGQFYGYQSVFEGVVQYVDGALDPLPLIENAMTAHSVNDERFTILAEALQELIFFELSSARTIDARERRTLMSMTTQLVASCLNSKRDDVA